jgi:Domain of unknown function (DUF1707)
MSGELVPDANMLMADADRERVVARLHAAVAEGRLTLTEFEERMSAVLAARTFGEVAPLTRDLPAVAPAQPQGPIVVRGATLRRSGRWPVPPRMQIEAHGSGVRLDFTQAMFTSSIVELEVYLRGSGTRLTLPLGSTVDMSAVSLTGSSIKQRGVGFEPRAGAPHFVVRGTAVGSSVKAAYPRSPRRWRWWPWRRQRLTDAPGARRP